MTGFREALLLGNLLRFTQDLRQKRIPGEQKQGRQVSLYPRVYIVGFFFFFFFFFIEISFFVKQMCFEQVKLFKLFLLKKTPDLVQQYLHINVFPKILCCVRCQTSVFSASNFAQKNVFFESKILKKYFSKKSWFWEQRQPAHKSAHIVVAF